MMLRNEPVQQEDLNRPVDLEDAQLKDTDNIKLSDPYIISYSSMINPVQVSSS